MTLELALTGCYHQFGVRLIKARLKPGLILGTQTQNWNQKISFCNEPNLEPYSWSENENWNTRWFLICFCRTGTGTKGAAISTTLKVSSRD